MAIVKKIRDNSGYGKEFETVTTSEVTYDTTPQLGSFNPVTSDGVAKAISGASGEVPAVNPGDAGKVLTAGFDGDTPTVSWEEAQGGSSYTAGAGISLANDTISVKHDSTLSEITAPTVYDTGDDTRSNYTPVITQRLYTAVKVRLGSVSDTATFATDTDQEYISFCLPQITEDPGLDGQYVKMVLANPSDRSKYVVGTVKSTATIEQSYNSSYQYYYAKISSSLSWTGTLSTMFDWGQLGVGDLADSDGYIDLYFVACDSAGNVLTTGTYGPTDSMFVLGFHYNGLKVNVSLSSDTKTLRVTNAVPGIDHNMRGKLLKVTGDDSQASMEWDYATRTSGVISGDGSLSDPYKLDHDSTLSENNDVIRISGGDGVSFNDTSYAYSISITEEQAAALNAAMAAMDPILRSEVKVKLSFASTPVMKLTSATSSQCYLHIGGEDDYFRSYAGVSQSIGTTDQNGVLVADLSDVTVSFVNNFAAGTCYIWVSTDSTKHPTPGEDYYGTKLSFTSDGTTPIAADISVGKQVTRLFVTDPVPAYSTSDNGKVLGVVDNSGSASLQWVNAGGGSSDQPLPAVAANTLRFEFENMSFDPTNDTGCNFTGTSWAKVTEAVTRNIWDCTISNDPSSSNCFNITEKCKVINGIYSRPLSNLFSKWTTPSSGYESSTGLISVDILLTGNAIYHKGANYAFSGCTKLKEVRFRSSYGMYFSSAKCMFKMCYALESVTATRPVSGSASSVGVFIGSSTKGMFHFCYSLKSISGFSIDSDVTSLDAENMFDSCAVLSSIDSMFSAVGSSFSISQADYMFQDCSKLVEIGSALKISGTSINGMFNNCTSLERVALLDLNNVVTNASVAFRGCTSLAEVNIVNSGSVTNWAEAFSTRQGIGGNTYYSSNAPMLKLPSLDTSGATDVSNMFRGRKYADGALAMYNQLTQQANPPTSYDYCFYECGSITHASDLAQIPSSWGGTGA